MKKSKAISLLLCLSLLASLLIPGTLAMPAKAAEGGTDNGMKVNKTATPNEDGTYQITLEAYATGEKISTEVTRDIPTDIVLVLDQSGSMANRDFPSVGETRFDAYTGNKTRNSYLYSKRHNNNGNSGNLYYVLEDGSYATVSVTRTQGEGSVNYTQCGDWSNYETSWGQVTECYYKYKDYLYVQNSDGTYSNVRLVRNNIGEWYNPHYVYIYTFPDGLTFESDGNAGKPGDFNGKGPLYYATTTSGEYTYTYTCTDADGNTINIGTSTGDNTHFTDATLYEKITTQGGNITRVQALKNAVSGFQSAVAEKAKGEDGQLGTEDDVNHRIAVVGFAAAKDSNPGDYVNTELFVGSTQYTYGSQAQNQYGNAFQDMNTTAGQNNVTASIGALETKGGTYVNLGIEMANGILDANPVHDGEKRNRVVIVFTDGIPGTGYWGDSATTTCATNAISQANIARSKGANVYTVGIFEGADATSAGNEYGTSTQKANWFMQTVSDNKGTPQTPSYYLSASDSSTLNNIFQQISDQIQEGGSAIDLGSEAVIKDIISPQFQLPAGTSVEDITLATAPCIGEGQFGTSVEATGVTPTISGNQVSVTGFDFKENWCGTETVNGTESYRGNKLIISFPVKVKDAFLGGNGVYTNTNAGVYENASETDPLFPFERPQVDVEIKQPTVTPEDKNVYLMGDLTAEQIKEGAVVNAGNVTINLDPTVVNYGLEPWQNEYVDITVTYKDKGGNTVTDLNNLRDDTTYTVEVTVSPKTEGEATAKTGSGKGNINVFKPELTYKDSTAYYGDPFTRDFTGNLEKTEWKHGNTTSTDTGVTMIGEAPELQFEYKPETDNAVVNGKINTKQDIAVSVDVRVEGMAANESLNDSVVFIHEACDPACGWKTPDPNNGNPAFLLHVKTCQLTITKEGGAVGEPYVFTVKKDNEKYSEVTIVGNGEATIVELPVGIYTIQEDEGWSWRYTGDNGNGASLTAQAPTGAITCTNTKAKNYWLNGYSGVVTNIFDVKH